MEAIKDAKEKGYHIVLLSGGIDVMVKPMAAKLGIGEWFATNKAVFNSENELVNIEDGGHEREAKLLLLQEFCLKHGYDISEVIEVADGGNDTELFKVTKGVLLGHNAELEPLAWKQIDSLADLATII
jgi:HAD superfamily phosphoserine phosphatase-like hydrolase